MAKKSKIEKCKDILAKKLRFNVETASFRQVYFAGEAVLVDYSHYLDDNTDKKQEQMMFSNLKRKFNELFISLENCQGFVNTKEVLSVLFSTLAKYSDELKKERQAQKSKEDKSLDEAALFFLFPHEICIADPSEEVWERVKKIAAKRNIPMPMLPSEKRRLQNEARKNERV